MTANRTLESSARPKPHNNPLGLVKDDDTAAPFPLAFEDSEIEANKDFSRIAIALPINDCDYLAKIAQSLKIFATIIIGFIEKLFLFFQKYDKL